MDCIVHKVAELNTNELLSLHFISSYTSGRAYRINFEL